jgi:hypothetical protein
VDQIISSETSRIHAPLRTRKVSRAALTVWLLLVYCGVLKAQVSPTEHQVKAAFLLNFTKFVEWPEAAFESQESPLSICILGDDPFAGPLDQLIEGETAGGRRIALQRIRRPPPPKACQVLYISNSEKNSKAILDGAGPGVLTVGDRDGFVREGGIIAFAVEGRHIRFDVNQRAATKASLNLSARMLGVARSVLR